VECEQVLVVMIPRADAGFGTNHEQQPGSQQPWAAGEEEDEHVEQAERRDAEHGKNVFPVAE
jgi:hypothetical protein